MGFGLGCLLRWNTARRPRLGWEKRRLLLLRILAGRKLGWSLRLWRLLRGRLRLGGRPGAWRWVEKGRVKEGSSGEMRG